MTWSDIFSKLGLQGLRLAKWDELHVGVRAAIIVLSKVIATILGIVLFFWLMCVHTAIFFGLLATVFCGGIIFVMWDNQVNALKWKEKEAQLRARYDVHTRRLREMERTGNGI